MLKGIFLDAEGTFLLFNPSLGEIYRKIWKDFRVNVDPEIISQKFKFYFKRVFKEKLKPPLNGEICKNAWKEVFEKVFEEFKNSEFFEKAFKRAYEFFAKPDCVKVVPGFKEFLTNGKEAGLKLAVISNWDCRLYSILEGHGLLPYFDAVFLGCEVGYLKPNAEIFKQALNYFSFKPEETIMIGDTLEDDIEVPKTLGMHTFHVKGNPDYHILWNYLNYNFLSSAKSLKN